MVSERKADRRRRAPGGEILPKMKRLVLLLALLLVAAVVTFELVAARPSSRPILGLAAPATGFGGYQEKVFMPIGQIASSWRVPAISAASSTGGASTWISVQGPLAASFVQLGTTEDDLDGRADYEGFWSDAAVRYNPQRIMDVHAGDRVRAQITLQASGWVAELVDITRHMRASVVISSAAGGTDIATWVQEDPTETLGGSSDAPYPVMAAPVFTDLQLNGAIPNLPYRDAQVLSTEGGVFLVPIRVHDDGFSFATPHGAARQYLVDVLPLDQEDFQFSKELSHWARLDRAMRRADLAREEGSLSTLRSTMLHQQWPAQALKAVVALTSADRVLIEALQQSRLSPQSVKMVWEAGSVHTAADQLRAVLGLPPAA